MLQALKLHNRISKGIVSLDHVRTPAKFIISGEDTCMHACRHACLPACLHACHGADVKRPTSLIHSAHVLCQWHMLQDHELTSSYCIHHR